jgi:hypothetical protein
MSRPAPKTLSEEDRQTVGEVRKELWVQGATGLAAGTVAGFVSHTFASIGNRRNWWKLKLNSNTGMLAVLLGGALGSFIGSSTAGKNEVHKMHPVFRKGQKTMGEIQDGLNANNNTEVVDDYRSAPTAPDTSNGFAGNGSMYQQSLQRAKDREMDLQVLERRRTDRDSSSTSAASDSLESGRVEREQNRLYRRATIHRTMEAGTSGLSDAHGGHWGDSKKDGSEGK